jgi:PKD repeat protein
VLGAIGDKTVNEQTLLAFTATATDADIPANALTFSLDAGSPAGATINGATGVFNWTPSEAQGPGTHAITVRVTDNGTPALSDFETITVTVIDANNAPTADADGPYTGSPGSPVNFDGTGSTDPDGDPLTYDWDFGDGNTGTGATVAHTYAASGVYTVTLRVTDPGNLFDEDTSTATIADFVAANVFYWKGLNIILPQILGTWIRMEPIGDSFDVHKVVLSSLRLTYNGTTIPSRCKSEIKDDSNHNGKKEIRACFRNQEIEPLFAALPNGLTTVTLTLEADLITGGKARGTTTAKVFKASWLHAGQMASVSPNPLNPQAKLSFVTLKPGVTTVQVFDVNGRLVRNLMERQYLMAGDHHLTIDGRNAQGNKLASGVYYYRVNSADGVTKGSFIVMK